MPIKCKEPLGAQENRNGHCIIEVSCFPVKNLLSGVKEDSRQERPQRPFVAEPCSRRAGVVTLPLG